MRIFIPDEFKERESEYTVSDHLGNSLYRAEHSYFLEKFGEFPEIDRVWFPISFGRIIDPGFRKFIEKYKFSPLSLDEVPGKTLGYFSTGRWISGDRTMTLNVETSQVHLIYRLCAKDEKSLEEALKFLRRQVSRTIKGKVLQHHDSPRIVPAKEVDEAISWNDLAPTIDNKIAKRVAEVVLPFFERVEKFKKAGVPPRLGILMHGSPGTGKTYLIRTLIREFRGKATIAHVSADHFVRNSIRDTFTFLQKFSPLVLIIEDVELVARSRSNLIDNPAVQALLDVIDGAVAPLDEVVLVATTNVPDQIDEAFKRPGRFDEVWQFGPPAPEHARRAFAGYFNKAKLEVPDKVVSAVGSLGLTYAELKYVSVDLIRRAIVSGGGISCTGGELEELCNDAKRGVQAPAIGFNRDVKASIGDLLAGEVPLGIEYYDPEEMPATIG